MSAKQHQFSSRHAGSNASAGQEFVDDSPRAPRESILPGFCAACPDEDACRLSQETTCRRALSLVQRRNGIRRAHA